MEASAKLKMVKEKKRKRKKKRPPHKSKMITGYIIYASEIRKDVIKKYPDRDFGDISKLVGIEWKNLPQETKTAYEKRAQEQNAKSKAIAAEAIELQKLATAAEELEAASLNISLNNSHQLPTTPCNGFKTNGQSYSVQQHDQSNSTISASVPSSPVQPLHIIQQHQQSPATTVQYCNNSGQASSASQSNSCLHSQSPPLEHQVQYQRNNIVYRKPATVRLRPKDATTQTDPTEWVNNGPKKSLRFSQKFIEYLSSRPEGHGAVVAVS